MFNSELRCDLEELHKSLREVPAKLGLCLETLSKVCRINHLLCSDSTSLPYALGLEIFLALDIIQEFINDTEFQAS